MKKAFTLIEMLVVVAIIVTLMTVVFKLSNVADEQNKRIDTVMKLQKLENCLSGYYAAFGSYPQVPVQGSRDIYTEVRNGVQTDQTNSRLDWGQVNAACRSQPVAACFPFREDERLGVQRYSDEIKRRTESGDYPAYASSPLASIFLRGFGIASASELSPYRTRTDWREVQIFRFGLMSYLVPRFVLMMDVDQGYFGSGASAFRQWSNNNILPCDPYDGEPMSSWGDVYGLVRRYKENPRERKIMNIVLQSVCSRWFPNLDGICDGGAQCSAFGMQIGGGGLPALEDYPPTIEFYSPGNSGSSWYVLKKMTVFDGWGNEFYYYSPEGHQSYTLWSAGGNGMTFPPWIDTATLSASEAQTVFDWVSDDIIRMRD